MQLSNSDVPGGTITSGTAVVALSSNETSYEGGRSSIDGGGVPSSFHNSGSQSFHLVS